MHRLRQLLGSVDTIDSADLEHDQLATGHEVRVVDRVDEKASRRPDDCYRGLCHSDRKWHLRSNKGDTRSAPATISIVELALSAAIVTLNTTTSTSDVRWPEV